MIPSAPAASRARRPVAIDLFSGAGGLSLGFESAGFDVVSAVEYDPVHAATHLYNFPNTDILCADISGISKAELLASAARGWINHNPEADWDGVVDAIVGGPSCQGFSVMGKQDADDERNQLIFEFVRLVREVMPRTFCLENVPGLLDPRFDEVRRRALDALREVGYRITGDDVIIRAEDHGVPQKRRRVIVLGVLGDEAPEALVQLTEESFNVSDAFAGLPELWRYTPLTTTDVLRLSNTAVERHEDAENSYLGFVGALGDGSELYGHRRQTVRGLLSGCRTTAHSEASAKRFGATAPGTKEPISRYFRLANDAPALTLRAGTGRERGSFSAARPLHPTSARVITVREAARIHSFPDWFRFHTTNWHAHRQIGNAVPPVLARAAAVTLMRALSIEPTKSTDPAVDFGDPSLLTLSPTAAARHFSIATDQVPKRKRPETFAAEGDRAA